MNFQQLALAIAKNEGLKVQVNIAQISEILRITLRILANLHVGELNRMLSRYRSVPIEDL